MIRSTGRASIYLGGQAGRSRELGREDDAAANPARTQVVQRLLSRIERSCLDRDRLDSAGARKNEQFLQLRQRAHGHAYYADGAKQSPVKNALRPIWGYCPGLSRR